MTAARGSPPFTDEWPCELCGGSMRSGAVWRFQDEDGIHLRDVPAEECTRCGCIRPDVRKIDAMDPGDIPSSVRERCAEIRFVNWRSASQSRQDLSSTRRLKSSRLPPCR